MKYISLLTLTFYILFSSSVNADKDIADQVAVFNVSGQVKKPQKMISYSGATLGQVIAKSGGLSVFSHIIFVYRRCVDAEYVYSFDFRMLKNKSIASFPLMPNDRIHVSGKQVFDGRPKIPSEISALMDKKQLPCYRVDYAAYKK